MLVSNECTMLKLGKMTVFRFLKKMKDEWLSNLHEKSERP